VPRPVHDLEKWIIQTNREALIAVTFVVNEQGKLVVADRSCEHISCSGDHAVLSAGELFFSVSNSTVEVVDVSNQSTGCCRPGPNRHSAPRPVYPLGHLPTLPGLRRANAAQPYLLSGGEPSHDNISQAAV
jgi:hypothetical protein